MKKTVRCAIRKAKRQPCKIKTLNNITRVSTEQYKEPHIATDGGIFERDYRLIDGFASIPSTPC